MEKCIIITAYIEGSIRNIVDTKGAYIICADGGYSKALAEKIRPSLLMGDFDSLSEELPSDTEVITFPTHKDETDTELALLHALEKGFAKVTIVGGIGGRLDHTIANIQNIVKYRKKGLEIEMADEQNRIFVLENEEINLPAKKGTKLSVFAQGGTAKGVSITGTEYPLSDFDLPSDFPLGVSNEFVSDSATVRVVEGTLLVVITSE